MGLLDAVIVEVLAPTHPLKVPVLEPQSLVVGGVVGTVEMETRGGLRT